MSLVHEALRKAEREKQRKLGSTPPAPHPAPSQPLYEPPAISTPVAHKSTAADKPTPGAREPNHFLLPALIACVAIVAIIAIVFLVSSASSVLRQSKDSPTTTAAPAAPVPSVKPTVTVEPQTAAQPAAPIPADSTPPPSVPPPTTPAVDDSKFTLSGIMQDPDGKYVAVVNGHVLYEGASVGGATVKKIDAGTVALDVNGHETLLRLF